MIGKLLAKIWPYLAIVVMGIAIYLLLKQLSSMQDNVDRLVHNMEQSMEDNNAQVLELTKQELKKFGTDTLLTALMDSFDIRFRNIGRVHKEKYYYTYDTTIHLLQTNVDSIWDFHHKFDGCVSVDGYVDVSNKLLTFNDLKVNYNSTTVYYWQRPYKFWFIKYGKKKYYLRTLNSCNNESKVEEIQISN